MQFPRWLRVLLLSPSVIAIAVATRLLLIANLDTSVAMKIATTEGLVGTLVGTLVPLLPLILPLFVAWLIVARRFILATLAAGSAALISPAEKSLEEDGSEVLSWQHLADCYTSPALLVLVMPLSFLVAFMTPPRALQRQTLDELIDKSAKEVTRRDSVGIIRTPRDMTTEDREEWRADQKLSIYRDELRKRKWKLVGRVALSVIISALSIPLVGTIDNFYKLPTTTNMNLSTVARKPWIPPERVQINESNQKEREVIGYILSTSENWTTILTEKKRTVEIFQTSDVKSRIVCILKEEAADSRDPLYPLEGLSRPASPPCEAPAKEREIDRA